MNSSYFQRVVAPVANRKDATATAGTVRHRVEGTGATVVAVHVIEKAGGALDKAAVEQREAEADAIFGDFTDGFADAGVTVETQLRYGSDVAASIIGAAHENDASAIVFTPRGGSRWRKLLSGDVTHNLVRNSDVPILILPDEEDPET